MKKTILALLALTTLVLAHGAEPKTYLPMDPVELIVYDFVFMLGIIIFSLIFPNMLNDKIKKIFFILIAVPVILITLYVGASSVYLNVISESGGPVHWHADFEIWTCGQELKLPTAKFPSNYVGTATLHHHDDNRIHIEGLFIKNQDVNLASFFEVIGGELTDSSIKVPQENTAPIEYKNGDACPSGRPGKLKVLVKNHETGEFEESMDISNYVIKPYFEVPPGDYLKIVFGDE